MGIATLIYDKRGCGASTGSYHDSLAIEDLAADALAGVEYLSARADIDGSQIGLNGASQGGWVAPYVAARSAKVSFLVVTSASGMTTWENGLYEMENDLRLEGYPESDIAKAREINNTFNEMLLQHGEGWAKLRSALESVRSEAWFRMARVPESLPETPEPANLRWVERERKTFFDPLPSWQRIKAPVLVVNGELDRNVPSRESLAKIEAALKKAGNKDYTIKLYPNADHQLWAIEKLGQRDGRSRQVGAYDARMEWLLAHVKIAR
jgi:pimeloyl-ACP methyl ester carboxylesterase